MMNKQKRNPEKNNAESEALSEWMSSTITQNSQRIGTKIVKNFSWPLEIFTTSILDSLTLGKIFEIHVFGGA